MGIMNRINKLTPKLRKQSIGLERMARPIQSAQFCNLAKADRTNREVKVIQCAQTCVFATCSMRCSEEMRWPLQRSVQLPLTSEVQQWKPY
jgi:hypothetical protein